MRWGFLGIGRVTNRMVEAIGAAGHTIECVAGRNPEKLEAWKQQFRVPKGTTNFGALVESDSIDAVYVALPPSLHEEWVAAALKHGKVVLCEKPLTMDFKAAERLGGLAREARRPLYHATAFPFHSRSLAMREVVQSGRLGTLARVTIACSFSHVLQRGPDHRTNPSLGGGCLLDLGWYCAYATLWMTGLKPISMQATGKRHRDTGIWLGAQAIVELEQGVTALWDCGYDAAGRKWIEIAGDQASLICDDFLRPWDADKPRYWIHGHDGKATCEVAGAGEFQERKMIESIERYPNAIAEETLEMALQTQSLLEEWERAMSKP